MSRGPGRIERAIDDLIEEHPEGAWTTEDLCRLIYPTANRTEKKHRVAVLRAMKKAVERHRDWGWFYSESRGTSRVFWNNANVMSYGLARLKASGYPRYVYTHQHKRGYCKTEEEFLEQLKPSGEKHDLVVSGGTWDRHVRQYIAERDGDQETAEKLAAEQEMAKRVADAGIRQAFQARRS